MTTSRRVRLTAVALAAGLAVLGAGVALASTPGTIATVAGTLTPSGPATSLGISPWEATPGPNGSMYVADWRAGRPAQNEVRLITSSGSETVIAGDGQEGFSGDGGPATSAELDGPRGVTSDAAGDVIIADSLNDRVRLVAATSCSSASTCPYGLTSMTKGDIYTILGSSGSAYSSSGTPGTNATIGEPQDVAVDPQGDLLISDPSALVVWLLASVNCSANCPYGLPSMIKGDVYAVAGTGAPGATGNGGPATAAKIYPYFLTVDPDGNLIIDDLHDDVVRLVADTTCSTTCPFGLSTMTAGDIYALAGDGATGASSDGGAATAATISPYGVATDARGDLLIADNDTPGSFSEDRIRIVAASPCSSASCPYGLSAMTAGHIYTVAGSVTPIPNPASGGTLPPPSNLGGPALDSQLELDQGLRVDSAGNILISEPNINDGVLMVAAGSCDSGCPYGLSATTADHIYGVAGNQTWAEAGDSGPATDAQFGLALESGIALDPSGDLLVDDTNDDRLRLIASASCASNCPYGLASMTSGDVYSIAGGGTGGSGDGGPATSAGLDTTAFGGGGVTVDAAGDAYVSEAGLSAVRVVADQTCSGTSCPLGLTQMTKGDIYTVAGTGTSNETGDGGSATSADLDYPEGLAVDPSGDLLIGEGLGTVRLVAGADCASDCPYGLTTLVKGDIYTVAGGGSGAATDGAAATIVSLTSAGSIATDAAGNLLIADGDDDVGTISLVADQNCTSGCPYGLGSMTAGDIYTIGGVASAEGDSGDGGPATAAEIAATQLTVDAAGNVVFGDATDDVVRMIASTTCSQSCAYGLSATTAGDVYTIAGTGVGGFSGDGAAATAAQLNAPAGVIGNSQGSLFILDTANGRVREVFGGASAAGSGPTGTTSTGTTATNFGPGSGSGGATSTTPRGTSTQTTTVSTPTPGVSRRSGAVGDQQVTLITPAACTAATTTLSVALSTQKRSGRHTPQLTFHRAVFFIDRGIKLIGRKTVREPGGHHRTITVVTYRPNATTTLATAIERLPLRGLKAGSHTLTVTVTYRFTKVVGHRHVRASASKTLIARFSVC